MKSVLLFVIIFWISLTAETISVTVPIENEVITWSTKLLLEPNCDLSSISVSFIKSRDIKEVHSTSPLETTPVAINDEIQSTVRKTISYTGWKYGQLGIYKLIDIYCREPHKFDSAVVSYSLLRKKRTRVKYRQYHYQQLKQSVSNPSMFERYESIVSRKREKETLAILIPEKVRVTLDSLDAYIKLKESVGYEVLLVTDDQWGSGIGDTAAENIRLWIKNNYEEKGLDYILFIGYPHTDKGEVPMKMTWPQFQLEKYREAPTDFYYAELTGDWDVDKDGNYGEFEDDFMKAGGPDQYAELNIGRIPVFSKTKTDHILNKMIKYESEKFTEAMSWRKNVLLPMNNMNAEDDPNFTPGIRLAEAIKYDILEPKGYKSFRIFDDNYDGFGLKTPAELTPCSYATVKETWNSQDFGLVVWQAHGFAQHATDVMSIPYSKVLKDDNVPFVFSTSCHNGSTNTDNLSMYLLQNGAINMVSATRVEYWAPGQDDFWDEWPSGGSMAYGYTKNLVEDSMPSAVALNRVKADIQTEMLELNSMWWMNWLVYNVYGDPTQGIYSCIDKGSVIKYPPVLSDFDTLKITKEDPVLIVSLADYVEDYDNSLEELQWDIESSELFTLDIDSATLSLGVVNGDLNCSDTVVLTVTDPDGQADSQEVVLHYESGTSFENALPLSKNSSLYLCKNLLAVGEKGNFLLLDNKIKAVGFSIYDQTGNELFSKTIETQASEKLFEIPFLPKASGSLYILFTCHYEHETKYYKAVLGVKK